MNISTVKDVAKLDAEQVDDLTGKELISCYNLLAGHKGLTQVTKFQDRATGIKRLLGLIQTVGLELVEAEMAAAKPRKQTLQPKGAITVSARCRELIGQGLDNAAIWAIIQPEFGLDAKKRTYPAWYRSAMARGHYKNGA